MRLSVAAAAVAPLLAAVEVSVVGSAHLEDQGGPAITTAQATKRYR